MALRAYLKTNTDWSEATLSWTANNWKVMLLSSAYTPDTTATGHHYVSDISTGIIARSANLASKTNVAGVLDAADVTLPSVSAGSTVTQIALYHDSGTDSSSELAFIYDAAGNLPFATSGGNVTVQWAGAPNYVLAFTMRAIGDKLRDLRDRLVGWLGGSRPQRERVIVLSLPTLQMPFLG